MPFVSDSLTNCWPIFCISRPYSIRRLLSTVTAGNASPLTDGAAMLMLMTAEEAEQRSVKPLGYLRQFAVVGVPPEIMGVGPVPAIRALLKKTSLRIEDIDLFEVNEAFAAQAAYCGRELGLAADKLNVNGGAGSIVLGANYDSETGYAGSGTLNIGAPAGYSAAAPGILNVSTVTTGNGSGVLQFNTTSAPDAPYYFTQDGTGSGTVIGIAGGKATGTAVPTLSGATGNPLGPIIYVVLVSVVIVAIGYTAWMQGYSRGRAFVTDILRSGAIDRVLIGAGVMGNMVLGALAASFIVVNLAPTVTIAGAQMNLQAAVLDPLFPGALALGLVVMTWWLLRRRVNPLALLVAYLVISMVAAYPFFGPDHTTSSDPAAQYQVCTSSLLHPYYACGAPPTPSTQP